MYVEKHGPEFRNRAGRLWEYVRAFIARLPGRCIPLLCTDANARVGLQRVSDAWVPGQSMAIGEQFPQQENSNGGRLRTMLEEHEMHAVNTFFPISETYYGFFGDRSRPDYICLPRSMQQNITGCRALYSVARRVQAFSAPGIRDHIPILVEFEYQLSFDGGEDRGVMERVELDRDLLADAVVRQRAVHEFRAEVNDRSRAVVQEFTRDPPKNPDVVYAKMQEVLREAAVVHFGAKRRIYKERPADT
eukprot:9165434-Alexandrium_andersonii.AAC.1